MGVSVKIKAKDLEPGMRVMLDGEPTTLSALRQCPETGCNTPIYCPVHHYANIDWVKSIALDAFGEDAELERAL
jgi:hypothetical protein